MDLHVVAPLASPAERAAVDAVISGIAGPPASGWSGGLRNSAVDGHVARGGHESRSHRDLLLPALHALQDRIGYISQPGLAYVCRRLTVPPAEAYGVATFYSMFATVPRPPVAAHVCDDIACRLAGAEELCGGLERSLGKAGEPRIGSEATWLRSPCLGRCELAPAALVTVAGEDRQAVAVGPVDTAALLGIVESATQGARIAPEETVSVPSPERLAHLRRSVPQAGDEGLRLLGRLGRTDPTSLDDYRSTGGYRALERAIEIGPEAVVAEVTASKLLGRGGAAFPTGRKWAAVRAAAGSPKYVVCNADESEPGTFKDRLVMEEDPYAIVEAMTIEGFATGADRGYLYLRGEYPLCESRMANALERAREAGLLGVEVLGSSFSFVIELRRGAGAYICGEETALFEAIEGKRGEPRNKPPFPVEVGLFGQPTAINNVETLLNIPTIILDGGAAFAALGTEESTGTKLFCLSGAVARPGLYEVAFGTTLRELLELAGGVVDPTGAGTQPTRPAWSASGPALDGAVRTILLGGAAGVFVGPDALDVPLTFEATRAIGATLGSGVVMVFDQSADMVGTLRRIAAFFRDESCGQCVPCRVGTVRQEEILARLEAGTTNGSPADEVALLRDLGQAMRDASICGLGQTASSAIESALRTPELVTM